MRQKGSNNWYDIDGQKRLLEEPVAPYGADFLFDPDDVTLRAKGAPRELKALPEDLMQPIIKWAGGKSKELKFIIPNAPGYTNFYEPFVGGGSVFAAVEGNHFYINDLSSELIALYRNISTQNKEFFSLTDEIIASWDRAHRFYNTEKGVLRELYLTYREGITNDVSTLKSQVALFCREREEEIRTIPGPSMRNDSWILCREIEDTLVRKFIRTKKIEADRHLLSYEDLDSTLETVIKGSLYMFYRALYNDAVAVPVDSVLHCALFLFIRNYCYSGMFRYNDDGKFNVPYGGIAYNSKSLTKKIDYYLSLPLRNKFNRTSIYNLDFEDFLKTVKPGPDDFVFLDPPYDSEFSSYAGNDFTRADQRRLADYLINECRAKWMLIIKNTDFIRGLYDNKEGILIRSFDKEYLVSFMNRNDKKVTHLLITNF